MKSPRLLTLLTDFGLHDEYVGVLKGVIAGKEPETQIIDICHNVPPHDIHGAAYMLEAAYAYFPQGTVHLCVVDPGVGSNRRILGACAGGFYFIAPDNGLLSFLQDNDDAVFYNLAYERPLSATFHGRDVMAGLAARLLQGAALSEMGAALALRDIVVLDDFRVAKPVDGVLRGKIVWRDYFGNLVTNMRLADLTACFGELGELKIEFCGERFVLHDYYAQVAVGAKLALINSRGYLELAQNTGDLARTLNLTEQGRQAEVMVFK